jgi:RNA polymerase sigma-70 factor (ECF subfamily)
LELTLNLTADELVDRCRKGDATGYRLVYQQYAKAMYNTALRIVNNTADAEDILQESFADAFQSMNEFQHRSTYGAWLKRIVINKAIKKVKREQKNWIELDSVNEPFVIESDPEIDEEAYEFRVGSIREGIKKLPPGYRTVLTLYLVENYRHEEIAEMLGINAATVRTQYLRAKKKLLDLICLK